MITARWGERRIPGLIDGLREKFQWLGPIGLALMLVGCLSSPDQLDRETDDFVQAYLAQSVQYAEHQAKPHAAIKQLSVKPSPDGSGDLVDAHLESADMLEVVEKLVLASGMPYQMGDISLHGRITALFADLPLVEAFNIIMAPAHAAVVIENGILVFTTGSQVLLNANLATATAPGPTVRTQITLRYIDSVSALQLLGQLQGTGPSGDEGQQGDNGGQSGESWSGSPDEAGEITVISQDGTVVTEVSDSDQSYSGGGPPGDPSSQLRAAPLPGTNTIFLAGPSAQVHEALVLLRFADQERPHVIIEALVLEADATAIKRLGTRITDAASGEFSGGSFLPGASLNDAITFSFLQGATNPSQLTAMIDLLTEREHARVISRPYATTLSHETADINITQDQYVIVEEADGVRSTTPISAGIAMTVSPQVLDGDFIRVTLSVEASEFLTSADATNVIVDRNAAKTVMDVRSGQTLVVGGLYRRLGVHGNAGIPLLRRIPGLNLFFSQRVWELLEREIIVYLTPHVWRPGRHSPAPLHEVKKKLLYIDEE